MKICDVVLNSIWFDPRVNRQIEQYMLDPEIELSLVGTKCERYSKEKIDKYRVPVEIVEIPKRYKGKQYSLYKKIIREWITNKMVSEAIVRMKPDIIHANDLNAFIPAMIAAKRINAKVIYDSHEIYTESGRVAKTLIYKKYLKLVEKKNILKCDGMVCVSHAAAEYFAEVYHINEPMVITNCMPTSYMLKQPPEKHPGFEVLNHGQFYEGRGYELMVKACGLLADLPEVHMCIRGFGVLEEALHREAEKLPNPEQFHFYPPVDVHDLIPEASFSHVGVAITLPISINFAKSVSNKIFEYIFAGLPVIMSDIEEHRYLNEKYHFGIILEENTPDCLANAVRKLYTDKELYVVCSQNAKKMSKELNWETEFRKLIAYEKGLMKA